MSTPNPVTALAPATAAAPALTLAKPNLSFADSHHHAVTELKSSHSHSSASHTHHAHSTSYFGDVTLGSHDCCSPVTTVVSGYSEHTHVMHAAAEHQVTHITSGALHNIHGVIDIINQPMVPKFVAVEDKFMHLSVKLFRLRIIECHQSLETASVTTTTWLKTVAGIRKRVEIDFKSIKESIEKNSAAIKANGALIKLAIEGIKTAIADQEYESGMMKEVNCNVVKEVKESVEARVCFVASWTEAIATSLVVATLAGDCCHIKSAHALHEHAAKLRSYRVEGIRLEAEMTSLIYKRGLVETQLMRLDADTRFVTARKVEVEHSLKAMSILMSSGAEVSRPNLPVPSGADLPRPKTPGTPGTPAPPYTAPRPPFVHLKDCKNLKLVGDRSQILQADYVTKSGVTKTSTLDIDSSLGAFEGEFDWGKTGFSLSSNLKMTSLNGTVLSAQLMNTSGGYKADKTDLNTRVIVVDGKLRFIEAETSPPTLKDCKNIKLVDKHTLQADCPNHAGVTKTSTLDLNTGLGVTNGHFDWHKQKFSEHAEAIHLKDKTILSAKLKLASGHGASQEALTDLNSHIFVNDGVLEFKL